MMKENQEDFRVKKITSDREGHYIVMKSQFPPKQADKSSMIRSGAVRESRSTTREG